MTALYFVANSLNYLVAGTGNRSELTIGYFTKHGDGGVDILPIGHLLKSDVQDDGAASLACRSRSSTSRQAPGCGSARPTRPRWASATPTSSGTSTNGPEGVSPALALRLERLIRATEHKRALPPDPSGTSF